MQAKLFNLPPMLFTPADVLNPNTCRTCQHREPTQCGGAIIQYCKVKGSNRTHNGHLKIKCKTPACGKYIKL